MSTYLLLDGHSLAYRAWFALQEAGMTTSSGQETTAVYGFVSMVTRLLADWRPDGMAVAFDRPEPTFRDEIAADYKAGRTAAPETFHAQVELIRHFVRLLGIPVLEIVGFEADDVIATLATRLRDAGEDAILVTGDRDAYQLVEDPHVRVLYNRRGVTDYVLYDEAGIFERTGVKPVDYPLLASLRGDHSDNLPGVPGVGEKTAAKLVNTYRDVDGIYSHLSELTPKLRESVTANEAQVRTNLAVIPLVRDVELDLEVPGDLGFGGVDIDGLRQLFDLLEMRAVRDRLFDVLDLMAGSAAGAGPEVAATGPSGPDVETLLAGLLQLATPAAAIEALAAISAAQVPVVVEAEWAGAPGRSPLRGLAIVSESPAVTALPAPVHGEGAPAVVAEADGSPDRSEWQAYFVGEDAIGDPAVVTALGLLLSAGGAGFSSHRSKELMRGLGASFGVDLTGLDLDTAVAAYLVDPALGQASLDDIAVRHGVPVGSTDVVDAGAGQLTLDLDGTPPDVGTGTVARAVAVTALVPRLRAALERGGSSDLYTDIERPLVRVLSRMELAGIGVDETRLREISETLTHETARLEEEIQKLAGRPFRVNSTPQLREVLYGDLELTPSRKTKTGYSTDATALERLRDQHPIIETLLEYREVEKLRSTYGEGLLAEVADDGRIHASFNQTVARTGRLSSDQPNLHNIPVRTEEGRRIRAVFVPAEGHELLVADYNQIELRVIAHLAEDPGLMEAFTAGIDIHGATASRVFGVALGDVTLAQRSKAKMISYGLAYGMEAYGLSQRLRVAVEEAAEILGQYFIAFPAVRAYMDRTVAEARARGYTETLYGRRRFIPELDSSNYRVRLAAERQAMNAGIQGLAADIFKVALVRLDAALEAGGYSSRIVLQVHDEVLVEVPLAEKEAVGALTVAVMRDACELRVPLEVNLSWGRSWADAKSA